MIFLKFLHKDSTIRKKKNSNKNQFFFFFLNKSNMGKVKKLTEFILYCSKKGYLKYDQ